MLLNFIITLLLALVTAFVLLPTYTGDNTVTQLNTNIGQLSSEVSKISTQLSELGSRVSALTSRVDDFESKLDLTVNSPTLQLELNYKVAFLEYYLAQMTKNVSGKPSEASCNSPDCKSETGSSPLQEDFLAWQANVAVFQKLKHFKDDLDNLMKVVSPSASLPSEHSMSGKEAELLRTLEQWRTVLIQGPTAPLSAPKKLESKSPEEKPPRHADSNDVGLEYNRKEAPNYKQDNAQHRNYVPYYRNPEYTQQPPPYQHYTGHPNNYYQYPNNNQYGAHLQYPHYTGAPQPSTPPDDASSYSYMWIFVCFCSMLGYLVFTKRLTLQLPLVLNQQQPTSN